MFCFLVHTNSHSVVPTSKSARLGTKIVNMKPLFKSINETQSFCVEGVCIYDSMVAFPVQHQFTRLLLYFQILMVSLFFIHFTLMQPIFISVNFSGHKSR